MGCRDVFVPIHSEYDLTRIDAIERLFDEHRPEILIHLAAVVGASARIGPNPGRFFYDNAIMGIQLIDAARRHGIEKTLSLGSICAYPKFTPVPFLEEELWNGIRRDERPLRMAKKMLLVHARLIGSIME